MQLPPAFLSLPDLPVCRILPDMAKRNPHFMFTGEQYLAHSQGRQVRAMPLRINSAFLYKQKQQAHLCHWAMTGLNKGKFAEAKSSANRKFWLYTSSAICSAAPARLSGKLPDFPKKLWREAGKGAIFYSKQVPCLLCSSFSIVYLLVSKLKSFPTMTYNPSSRTAYCAQREISWDTGKELTFFFSLKKNDPFF